MTLLRSMILQNVTDSGRFFLLDQNHEKDLSIKMSKKVVLILRVLRLLFSSRSRISRFFVLCEIICSMRYTISLFYSSKCK